MQSPRGDASLLLPIIGNSEWWNDGLWGWSGERWRGGGRQVGVSGQGERPNVPEKEGGGKCSIMERRNKGLMGQRAMEMEKKKIIRVSSEVEYI